MRISQRTMYLNNINNMQKNMSTYMEYNMKGASQKDVNRPSDDPAGTARILMYRNSLSDISQYERNLSTAYGWLSETDSLMTSITSTLTRVKTLAEQAATGTYTAEQRDNACREVREMFQQLINTSNTRYENKSIFCGQNYNSSAFDYILAADCYDTDFMDDLQAAREGNLPAPGSPPDWITFSGTLDSTALVRFPLGGTAGAGNIDYEYTLDGGKTWTTGIMTAADREVNLNGVIMTIPDGVRIPAFDEDNTTATQMWVRPSAMYNGSDNDMTPQIVRRGVSGNLETTTTGVFATDIQVRFDSDIINWSAGNENFTYSYSTDGGKTWTQKTGNTGDNRLVVPGGFVEINDLAATGVTAGQELTVKPQRTSLSMKSDSDVMAIANNIGKDVFGGQYMTLDAQGNPVQMTALNGEPANIFETVGKLVGYMETNNQDGISQCVADLTKSLEHITSYAAKIGGRKNALEVTQEVLTIKGDSQTEAMSNIEDIDLTQLLMKLTQSQLAYSTVLKSSSMIMQLNLTQYI